MAVAPGNELAFVTQGDANVSRDPGPVPARMVRGRVLWSVTLLGTAMEWLQWPRSFLVLVLLPLGLLAVAEVRARRAAARVRALSPPELPPEPVPGAAPRSPEPTLR